jgi:hypothetical protein
MPAPLTDCRRRIDGARTSRTPPGPRVHTGPALMHPSNVTLGTVMSVLQFRSGGGRAKRTPPQHSHRHRTQESTGGDNEAHGHGWREHRAYARSLAAPLPRKLTACCCVFWPPPLSHNGGREWPLTRPEIPGWPGGEASDILSRAMVCTGVFLGLVTGIFGPPLGWSLLPFAIVMAGLFATPQWWRRKPPNRVRLPARIPGQPPHYHYCDACDQQWRHDEPDCVAHWALHCLMCAEPRERPTASAG